MKTRLLKKLRKKFAIYSIMFDKKCQNIKYQVYTKDDFVSGHCTLEEAKKDVVKIVHKDMENYLEDNKKNRPVTLFRRYYPW